MSTVSKLQIVLEATTTAFDRGLRKAQDGLNAFAKQTDKIHAKMESFQKRHQGAFDAMQAIGAASAVGLVAIGAGIKATTAEAMKFESAMAEVKKVVNFESPDGIKQMRAELEELSTRVPIAFDGLAKIAAAAGQSGIAANEIVKFTEAAAKMGTAFDITAEQAGQAMAEMRTAFKMSQAEVETLADKINYLGNNSPNAAAKIMEVVQRIGPLGEIAGVSADQIAAMAASLTSVEPDVAATGLKNMMLQLVKGESLSKSAKAAFDDLGLSYTEIAKGMQTDSIGTINKVFEAIKKLPEEAQAAKINDIFGSESIAVISQLINGTDTLGKHLQAMGDASKYAGSMSQEAANINDTSAAKMEMFKNATQNAKAAIGDAFLPALGALAEALLPVINGIKQFAQESPTMVTAITGIVGGVLVLGTALGAIGLAVPLVTTALGGLTAIAGLVGTAIGAISLPVVAVVAGITALIAAGEALYNNWDMVKAKAAQTFNALPAPVKEAINNIKSLFAGIGDFVSSSLQVILPIAQAVWHSFSTIPIAAFELIKATISGAMSAIGAVIKANVTVIASVFNAGFNFVKTVITTAFNVIKAAIRGDMSGVESAIKNGLSRAVSIVKQAATNIVNALKTLGRDLLQAGRDAVQGFINGMNEKIGAAVAKAKELASRAKSAVTGFFDIRSPSRVMKQIGEWVSEGMAIGIAAKAPMAVDEAKKMAENAKKAVESEMESLARSIFIAQQKIAGNPFAELTADIAFGKYQGQDTTQLLALKEEERRLGSILSMTDDLRKLKQDIALVGKSNLEIMEWEYQHTDKYLGITREQFDVYKKANAELERRNKLLADTNDLAKKQQDLQKRVALFGNTDPLAEVKYDLQFSTANQAQKDAYLGDLSRQNAKEAFDSLQNSYHIETPAQKLEREYQEKLAIVTNYEQQIGDTVSAAVALRTQIESEYAKKVVELESQAYTERLNSMQSGINLASGVWDKMTEIVKNAYGEQSTAAKIMFAGQKIIAMAQALINTELAATKALAEGGAIAGIPMANMVRAAGYASIGLMAGQTIGSLAGQAHSGIANVPREGTWILDKGERVVKPRDNDRLTKFLDNPNRFVRGESKVIINNYSGEPASASQTPDGNWMVTIGKMVGDAIDYKLAERDAKAHRQGWGY